MDLELRRLCREARISGNIDAEIKYLRALLRAKQINEQQLELASYLGYPAAEQIQPYDIPYRIAELQNRPPPELPNTSWFCEPFERPSIMDSGDIAHLWTDNILGEFDDEEIPKLKNLQIAKVATMLGLNFVIMNLAADESEESKEELTELYSDLREVIIEKDFRWAHRLTSGLEWRIQHWLLDSMGGSADAPAVNQYINDIFLSIMSTIRDSDGGDWRGVRHYLRGTFTHIIDLCIHTALGLDLCNYLSRSLLPLILGYQTLEETLPTNPFRRPNPDPQPEERLYQLQDTYFLNKDPALREKINTLRERLGLGLLPTTQCDLCKEPIPDTLFIYCEECRSDLCEDCWDVTCIVCHNNFCKICHIALFPDGKICDICLEGEI